MVTQIVPANIMTEIAPGMKVNRVYLHIEAAEHKEVRWEVDTEGSLRLYLKEKEEQ